MNQKHRLLLLPVIVLDVLVITAGMPNVPAPMEIHCKHFFHGYPIGNPASNDLIIRDIYALSHCHWGSLGAGSNRSVRPTAFEP